tara:strand:+ start:282 stop:473 length:192 start_codon:yes stop_codon:yes gene_type:complete
MSYYLTAAALWFGEPLPALVGLTGMSTGLFLHIGMTTSRGFERRAEKNLKKAIRKYNKKIDTQ